MHTLLARLKAETRFQHLRLERELDLLGEGVTGSGQRRLLQRMYGFYRPWEERAVPVLERGHPGITSGRSKLALLAADLGRLGDSPGAIEALPDCEAMPDLDTFPAALGSMYVLEGATLGGQIVSRHLRIGAEAAPGASFFRSYGAGVGPMWRRFGEAVAAHAGVADDRMVQSAKETFAALHAWLIPAAERPRR